MQVCSNVLLMLYAALMMHIHDIVDVVRKLFIVRFSEDGYSARIKEENTHNIM